MSPSPSTSLDPSYFLHAYLFPIVSLCITRHIASFPTFPFYHQILWFFCYSRCLCLFFPFETYPNYHDLFFRIVSTLLELLLHRTRFTYIFFFIPKKKIIKKYKTSSFRPFVYFRGVLFPYLSLSNIRIRSHGRFCFFFLERHLDPNRGYLPVICKRHTSPQFSQFTAVGYIYLYRKIDRIEIDIFSREPHLTIGSFSFCNFVLSTIDRIIITRRK